MPSAVNAKRVLLALKLSAAIFRISLINMVSRALTSVCSKPCWRTSSAVFICLKETDACARDWFPPKAPEDLDSLSAYLPPVDYAGPPPPAKPENIPICPISNALKRSGRSRPGTGRESEAALAAERCLFYSDAAHISLQLPPQPRQRINRKRLGPRLPVDSGPTESRLGVDPGRAQVVGQRLAFLRKGHFHHPQK